MRPAAFSVKCLVLGIALFLFAAFARGAAPVDGEGTVFVSLTCGALPEVAREVSDLRLVCANGETLEAERLHDSIWRFREVPPGYHTLHIDHPWIEAVLQEEVSRDSSLHVRLVPSAGLRLRVLDEETGRPLLGVRTSARRSGPCGSSLHMDPVGTVRVIPGTWTLDIGAPDHAGVEVTVERLLAGEVRELEVRLSPYHVVRGRFVLAGGASPVEGACVRLQRIGERPQPKRSPDFGLNWPEDLRLVDYTNRDGAFELFAPAGEYALHAFASPKVFATREPFTIPRTGVVEEAVLELPGGEAVVCRLAPRQGSARGSDADWTGLRACAEAIKKPSRARVQTSPLIVDVDARGQFSFEALPPGTFRISLLATRSPLSFGSAKDALQETGTLRTILGHLEVVPGVPVTRKFDFGSKRPGDLTLQFLPPGTCADGFLLELRLRPERDGRGASVPRIHSLASALSNPHGSARLRGLPQGSYRAFVRPPDGRWEVELDPLSISGGSLTAVTHRLDLGLREVLCVRAEDDVPLLRAAVRLVKPSGGFTGMLTSDAGTLALELPHGTFRLETGWGPERRVALLVCGDEDTPRLRFERDANN